MPRALSAAFAPGRLQPDRSLAPLTTFRIGGPADWCVEAFTAGDVATAVQAAAADGLPVTVMGGGSNLLVGDRGVRGLVLQARAGGNARVAPDLVRGDAGTTINRRVRWTGHEGQGGPMREPRPPALFDAPPTMAGAGGPRGPARREPWGGPSAATHTGRDA